MTDENLKAALNAALVHMPDGYFAIIICGPIPEFGQQNAPGAVDLCTTTTAEIMQDIIVRMGRKIEASRGASPPLPDPGRN